MWLTAAATAGLRDDLRHLSDVAADVPRLRHPPWLTSEAAKTVFKDVDLDDLARSREEGWRKKGSVLREEELPPIVLHKTATGMVILKEGGPVGEAAAGAGATGRKSRAASGSRQRGKADGSSADKGGKEMERGILEAAKVRGKRVVRFRYAFRPPPWTLPKGVRRPLNQQAAYSAGVRRDGRIRLPVAPSHLRYIEALEDEVGNLASEHEFRKSMLLAKIERYMEVMWRPPGVGTAPGHSSLGHGGDGSGAGGGGLGAFGGRAGSRSRSDSGSGSTSGSSGSSSGTTSGSGSDSSDEG